MFSNELSNFFRFLCCIAFMVIPGWIWARGHKVAILDGCSSFIILPRDSTSAVRACPSARPSRPTPGTWNSLQVLTLPPPTYPHPLPSTPYPALWTAQRKWSQGEACGKSSGSGQRPLSSDLRREPVALWWGSIDFWREPATPIRWKCLAFYQGTENIQIKQLTGSRSQLSC